MRREPAEHGCRSADGGRYDETGALSSPIWLVAIRTGPWLVAGVYSFAGADDGLGRPWASGEGEDRHAVEFERGRVSTEVGDTIEERLEREREGRCSF